MPASDKTKPHLIYVIECIDGRRYVGATTSTLARRWRSGHLSLLRNGKHLNGPLQEAWRLYGDEGFTVSVLATVRGCDANRCELRWIRRLRAFAPHGFNLGDPTNLASHARKSFVVTSPRGRVYRVVNLHAFCRKHGLTSPCMTLVAQGKKPAHKGWLCAYAEVV